MTASTNNRRFEQSVRRNLETTEIGTRLMLPRGGRPIGAGDRRCQEQDIGIPFLPKGPTF